MAAMTYMQTIFMSIMFRLFFAFRVLPVSRWLPPLNVFQVPSGQGLAFLTFTEAITKMHLGPVWSVIFFLMLITIGIDTEFGMLEGVVTPVIDMKLLPKWKKEHISGEMLVVSLICACPCVFT